MYQVKRLVKWCLAVVLIAASAKAMTGQTREQAGPCFQVPRLGPVCPPKYDDDSLIGGFGG